LAKQRQEEEEAEKRAEYEAKRKASLKKIEE